MYCISLQNVYECIHHNWLEIDFCCLKARLFSEIVLPYAQVNDADNDMFHPCHHQPCCPIVFLKSKLFSYWIEWGSVVTYVFIAVCSSFEENESPSLFVL